MTLLDLKPSTVDIDFTGPSEDISQFETAHLSLHHGFRIDSWKEGQVLMVLLPSDYLEKSLPVKSPLEKIKLRALNPIDIIVTKIARLNQRDWQDIESCITNRGVTADQIRLRAEEVGYAGSETAYELNRDSVLNKFFGRNA